MSAPATTRSRRARSWGWPAVALLAITVTALLYAVLTTPRTGGYLDPSSDAADGSRALVNLLRDQGVQVITADTVEQALAAAEPDSLLLVAQTAFLPDRDLLDRLADAPGDRLLIRPATPAREALADAVRPASTLPHRQPTCGLHAAQRAGAADLGSAQTFGGTDGAPGLVSCYGGALVQYRDGERLITVSGSASFLMNSTLLQAGNAALGLNLAGTQPRLIWYAPRQLEGDRSSTATIFDLIPDRVNWIVAQLVLAVLLLALWQGRRLGPLVAERLPVVVRASETVEGRGRLYRSHRARDRAADALRTGARDRLLPRLGLTQSATPDQLISVLATQTGVPPGQLGALLYGPVPPSDEELVQLAHALDDIERKVAHP